MSIRITVLCNGKPGCPSTVIGPTTREARLSAYQDGWVVNGARKGTRVDICPDCRLPQGKPRTRPHG